MVRVCGLCCITLYTHSIQLRFQQSEISPQRVCKYSTQILHSYSSCTWMGIGAMKCLGIISFERNETKTWTNKENEKKNNTKIKRTSSKTLYEKQFCKTLFLMHDCDQKNFTFRLFVTCIISLVGLGMPFRTRKSHLTIKWINSMGCRFSSPSFHHNKLLCKRHLFVSGERKSHESDGKRRLVFEPDCDITTMIIRIQMDFLANE